MATEVDMWSASVKGIILYILLCGMKGGRREGRIHGRAATSGEWRAAAGRQPGRVPTGNERSRAGAAASGGVRRLPSTVTMKKKGDDTSGFENRIRVGVFQSFPVSAGVRKK
jgi:hypothetical protein